MESLLHKIDKALFSPRSVPISFQESMALLNTSAPFVATATNEAVASLGEGGNGMGGQAGDLGDSAPMEPSIAIVVGDNGESQRATGTGSHIMLITEAGKEGEDATETAVPRGSMLGSNVRREI